MLPTRVGPYRLVDHIGSGGMGEVYRAWDERLKRWVAVKQVRLDAEDPDRYQRFRREAQATAKLNHPTIVQLYDVLEFDDSEWIVMEHVDGETLATLLTDGPLELERGLRLARQIAAGLAEAHSRGIIHRDLKSENIMVTPAEKVKILDFGLAKLFRLEGYDSSEPDTWKSVAGRIVGTSRAMSPEQAQALPIDFRSDLFSLGTLFFEVFTGTSPFKGYSHIDTLNRVCTHSQPEAAEVNPELPRRLGELIERLLEKDPADRPQSADEVLVILDATAGGGREVSETLPISVGRRSSAALTKPPPSDPTRPGRPLPPGGGAPGNGHDSSVGRPFWRRFSLPSVLLGILDSLPGSQEYRISLRKWLRKNRDSESLDS